MHIETIASGTTLDAHAFAGSFLAKGRPVLIRGMASSWRACKLWTPPHLKERFGEVKVPVKEILEHGIRVTQWSLADYADFISRYESEPELRKRHTAIPYCHDVPIFHLIPDLIHDVDPFPSDYLPKWYRERWWRFVQFFLGPSSTVTPLHFDTLITNNLFFQILGRKKFTFISWKDRGFCYPKGWRWFDVDPARPDYGRHPLFKNAQLTEVIVNPGDTLFMPAGMLHHVQSLDVSISFNVDFHTPKTAMSALGNITRGMPAENAYYNLISLAAVSANLAPEKLFKMYSGYLNYVS